MTSPAPGASFALEMDDPPWLEKARGYLELGMLDEAWRELERLPAGRDASAEAQEMRIAVLLDRREFDKALTLCEVLCELHPANHAGFLQGAWCLHEQGASEAAIKHLHAGPETLRDEPVFFYNLACYELALGREQAAQTWLRRSFEMEETFREKALADPDLAAVREQVEENDFPEEDSA